MKLFKLTSGAEADLFDIWKYSYQTWGKNQADHYIDLLEAQCEALIDGHVLIKSHDDLYPSLRSIPCEHHHIFYLHEKNEQPIILAFFYERMDFIERLKRRI